jgi:hypothetical protein
MMALGMLDVDYRAFAHDLLECALNADVVLLAVKLRHLCADVLEQRDVRLLVVAGFASDGNQFFESRK